MAVSCRNICAPLALLTITCCWIFSVSRSFSYNCHSSYCPTETNLVQHSSVWLSVCLVCCRTCIHRTL